MDTLTGNPKPTELRRSCVFCRQRKMRCSGDLPCCTTCRQREKPCVYEPVAFKGRYAAAATAASIASSQQQSQQKSTTTFNLSRSTEYGIETTNNFHDYGNAEHLDRSGLPTHLQHQNIPPPPTMEGNLVGDELTFLFGTFFAMTQQSALIHNVIQRANNGSSTLPPFSVPLTYVDALPVITFDLIRLTMARLNSTNAEHTLNDHSSLPYVQSLIIDRSMTVIDGLDNPEAEQWFGIHGPPSSNQVEHLLEMAFNHHPLVALIVPKTPFMRDHHEGQSNYCLLWLLCSEGIELGLPTVGIKPNTPLVFSLPSSASFLQLAWKQLFNSHQNVPAERFWISQALLLLGFRLLCHGHVKQATAFLLLCVRCIARVVTDRSRNPALEVKINGIRMTEVEEQAINNVFWISHALLLWIWSQVDQADVDLARFICPDPPVLFTTITAAKIPSTALCADAIYKLDYVSANFTSLNVHTSNARSLTVLAHICNMIHTLINNGTTHATQSSSSSAVFYNQAFSQFGEHHDTSGHVATDDQASGSGTVDCTGSTMYAAISAKLLHQTKQILTAILHPHLTDKYTDKTILCAAYLFAICLCEPSKQSNTFSSSSQSPHLAQSPTQQKELAHRFRAAMDIASGMIRDCKDDGMVFHQLAPPKERILIQSLFGRASKVLARIFAHLKQDATESNREGQSHNDQSNDIFDTGLSMHEITSTIRLIDDHASKKYFPLCLTSFDTTYRTGSLFNSSKVESLDDIAAIARSIISPKGNANDGNPLNIQRMNSDTAIIADQYSRGNDGHRKASMPGTSINNEDNRSNDTAAWQAQDTQRARSFSDSAAIYSTTSHAAHMPGNMTFVQPPTYPTIFHNMPPPPPPAFTSFTTAMNAAVVGGHSNELAPPSQIDPKSTNESGINGGLRRSRTYSINEIRSDSSFPSSFPSSVSVGQFPPSPPQSAPPSHLALLSDTSATLQAMLQDYNNNSNASTAPSSTIPSANGNQATNMMNYTNQNHNQNSHQQQQPHYHCDHQNNGGEGGSNASNENLAATRTANWAANNGGGILNSDCTSNAFSNDVKMPFH